MADELIAEKLAHAIDLLRVEMRELRQEQAHQKELFESRVRRLEVDTADHEQRLRANTEGVTQFKVFSGLASGGSTLASLIALIRSFFNP